jgi:hypothetical protein
MTIFAVSLIFVQPAPSVMVQINEIVPATLRPVTVVLGSDGVVIVANGKNPILVQLPVNPPGNAAPSVAEEPTQTVISEPAIVPAAGHCAFMFKLTKNVATIICSDFFNILTYLLDWLLSISVKAGKYINSLITND